MNRRAPLAALAALLLCLLAPAAMSPAAAAGPESPGLQQLAPPAWLDLGVLELQIYGEDFRLPRPLHPLPGSVPAPGWLQRPLDPPVPELQLLHSDLGPPTLLFFMPAGSGGKPGIVRIATWPEDGFADEPCLSPEGAAPAPLLRNDPAEAPPRFLPLLPKPEGLAVAVPLRGEDTEGWFESQVVARLTGGRLEPLICVRTAIPSRPPPARPAEAGGNGAGPQRWRLEPGPTATAGHADIVMRPLTPATAPHLLRWLPARHRYALLTAHGPVLARAPESALPRLCGWFDLGEPSPAEEAVFTDHTGHWTVPRAAGPWPVFVPGQLAHRPGATTPLRRLGCACFNATTDDRARRITRLENPEARPLGACWRDRGLDPLG